MKAWLAVSVLVLFTACEGVLRVPSSLQLASGVDFDSDYVLVDTERSIEVTNNGSHTLRGLQVTVEGERFQFKGGSYPGTGGTCATELNGFSTCSLILIYSRTKTGDHEGALHVSAGTFAASGESTIHLSGHSQGGIWIWFHGSPTSKSTSGSYGEKGVATPTTIPGSRTRAVGWRDAKNQLWVYGGEGVDGSGSSGLLGDLWKYDFSTEMWTWVNGDNTLNAPVISGSQPGSRLAIGAWESSGEFFLFGGLIPGTKGLADVWKWNTTTSQWTWLKGDAAPDQLPDFGSLGVASNSNNPGGGWMGCTTSIGNRVGFFGGFMVGSDGNRGNMNALWFYDSATNQWTWRSGATVRNDVGVYGSKGQPSSSNHPGARRGCQAWFDRDGRFWLFGGFGYAATAVEGYLGDLWKFDPNDNTWTWVDGDSSIDGTGGTLPSARRDGQVWTTTNGITYLYGGEHSRLHLSDLWTFDGSRWSQLGGESSGLPLAPVWGLRKQPAAANWPGERRNSTTALGREGWLWLFGGGSPDGTYNDLWAYVPE